MLPILLFALPLLLAARPTLAQVTAADSTYLVANTQALLDAVTYGDTTVWARQLAPGWMQSDEEGHISWRKEFLAGLHGLPPGQSGTLKVARCRLAGGRDVAVISYDADEEHHYYGQLLLTRFHGTDTYIRSGGQWLQLASQMTALPRAIAGRPLPAPVAREYAGTYALTEEIKLTVTASDSGLSLERAGRPSQRLYALDDRLFVRHGIRGFWVFERDGSGAVMQVVNWRDNNPVTWKRVR